MSLPSSGASGGIEGVPGETSGLGRRLAAGAGWAQVSRIAEVFSSLLLSLLLVRALRPTAYGEYSFLVNAAALGAVILGLGFAETLMRFVAQLIGQGASGQVAALVRWLVVARLATNSAGILLLLALHGVVARLFHLPLFDRFWVAIALLLLSQSLIEFATSYAYARLRSRDVAIARTVGQLLALAFFVAIVALRLQDPITAAVTVSISYLAATVVLAIRGVGPILLERPAPVPAMRQIAGYALTAWVVNIFTLGLAGQIDVILLGGLRRDIAQIAFYSVATLTFVKLGVLLSGWIGTAISNFAEVRVRRGAETASRLFTMYLRLSVLISLSVYPPLVLMSSPIVRQVFGAAYAPAGSLMAVSGGFWLVSASLAASIPYTVLMAVGAQRQALFIRAGTGVLNVVLDVLLIPPLGALGAIIATGVANAIAHLCDYVVAASQVQIRYPWGFLVRVGLAAVVGLVPVWILRPQSVAGLVAGLIIYALAFGASLMLTRPLGPGDVELATRLNTKAGMFARRFARPSQGRLDDIGPLDS